MKKPNVVLIYVDNQAAKMPGCAGNDEIHTPNLDSLASEGVRFIENQSTDWSNAVFMEQEETRSIRTPEWLFMKRFEPTSYHFANEQYDLTRDTGERKNLAQDPAFHDTVEMLSNKVSEFFNTHSVARWNLWE